MKKKSEFFQFLVVKFSIYLNRHVFVIEYVQVQIYIRAIPEKKIKRKEIKHRGKRGWGSGERGRNRYIFTWVR